MLKSQSFYVMQLANKLQVHWEKYSIFSPVQYCANRTPFTFCHFHQLILLRSIPDFLVLSVALYYHVRSFFPASNF